MNLTRNIKLLVLATTLVMFGCKKDSNEPAPTPTVSSTLPAANAAGVAKNATVSAVFSTGMNATTLTTSTFTLAKGTTPVAGTVAYNGTTATFTPTAQMEGGLVYTATITTGAKTPTGVAMAANKVWTFTTVGTAASSTDPGESVTGVPQNKVIAIVFSGPMDASTINTSTFTLMQGTTPVAGTVSYASGTATFTPTNPLAGNTVYTATVTSGVKDAAGNAFAGKTWTFTTVDIPAVNSTDPFSNATAVARNKKITITFSEAMNASTITTSTFTVTQGSTPVAGTVTYSGTTATFTATSLMAVTTVYTATVTTGVKNVAGNALAANKVWSFTTGGSASTLAAVGLGAAGNYVILAKTAVNNNPTSAVTGDIGLSPAAASFITGFSLTAATGYATSSQVTGNVYAADQAAPTPINLTTAVSDMQTAYTDAAGRVSPDFGELGTGNIGGMTLAPGLYKWTNTVTMPTSLTISGSATDVWIFQISGDLTMSSAVNITLTGGALPKNIFWQVAGTVTIGTTAHFEGVILSKTGITLQTGASMNGRALAQTAVILDANAVTKPN
jgi:hypothetical protein